MLRNFKSRLQGSGEDAVPGSRGGSNETSLLPLILSNVVFSNHTWSIMAPNAILTRISDERTFSYKWWIILRVPFSLDDFKLQSISSRLFLLLVDNRLSWYDSFEDFITLRQYVRARRGLGSENQIYICYETIFFFFFLSNFTEKWQNRMLLFRRILLLVFAADKENSLLENYFTKIVG